MKLLIVDDEKLTREGLRDSIDWNSLGIRNVVCADDGMHGLEMAATFQPDIVLSDVRMPRMTGIEMCEKLQAKNPALRIVFMSGYSDKEYLKAAIRLRAVSYVEKPISEEEIVEAVKEGIEEISKERIKEVGETESRSFTNRRLAMELCQPKVVDIKSTQLSGVGSVFSLLIKIYHCNLSPDTVLAQLNSRLNPIFTNHYIKNLHCVRPGLLYVYHLWGFKNYSDSQKKVLATEIVDALSRDNLHFHIVLGKVVDSPNDVYQSYNSAVIELQRCFFERRNTYRIYQSGEKSMDFPVISDEEADKEFRSLLLNGNQEKTAIFIQEQLDKILGYDSILPNQVKDLFYRYFTALKEVEGILGMKSEQLGESAWGLISGCESVYELVELLQEKTQDFFDKAKERSDTGSTVAMIREYINIHFSNDTLSIKDISEHVYLSTSYICTLFKNETGQTLNQYITEFRINKAKELLRDPRNRINDISAAVGYSDGNYFGKTFKKQVGMSPTEYRDKNQ